MNTSELRSLIREEIISVLKEADSDLSAKELEARADATKDLNKELEKTVDLNKELQKENDDEEPTTSQLKGASKDSIAVIAGKLQQVSSELKSIANKWKKAEGDEKETLKNRLLTLTNIKKELESMLE